VSLDGRGPIRPAILYSDNRALEQLARVQAVLGASLTAQAVTPKWLWLAEHEPDGLARAGAMCSSHNYVAYRLTDSLAIDYDTASIFGGIFDAPRKAWDLSVCEALGLDDPLLRTARRHGYHQPCKCCSEATGLPPGIP
jgi:xylulokinase